ncbi:hypothetical protein [Agromyces neolithicus]|uniref:Uncharacterized protein n=1 Tax=Agromyces neolithicus TaxID=269420 RepID=A0ABP4Y8X8_9MICO
MTDTTNPGDASSRDTSTRDTTPPDSSVGNADRTTTVLPEWVTAGQTSTGETSADDGPSTATPATTAPVPPPAPAPAPPSADVVERPTIRWGALVWSLLFGATAGFTLWVLIDPSRRLAVGEWLTTLNPLAAGLYGLIALGVILALFGIVGLIRRGERARHA